jgi:trimeric autotransporter adhesin
MRNTILSILILISSTAFAQLTIPNGAQLTVTNDGYLYANEAIVNQGTVTLNSGKLILANNFNNALGTLSAANASLEVVGANTQSFTFGSNDIVKRVELNKSANTATVAAGKLTITDGFKSVAGTLDASEKIILQSTSTKTAIVEPSTAGTVTNMVVERFIPAKRAFRLLSSPVTSTTSIKYNHGRL